MAAKDGGGEGRPLPAADGDLDALRSAVHELGEALVQHRQAWDAAKARGDTAAMAGAAGAATHAAIRFIEAAVDGVGDGLADPIRALLREAADVSRGAWSPLLGAGDRRSKPGALDRAEVLAAAALDLFVIAGMRLSDASAKVAAAIDRDASSVREWRALLSEGRASAHRQALWKSHVARRDAEAAPFEKPDARALPTAEQMLALARDAFESVMILPNPADR